MSTFAEAAKAFEANLSLDDLSADQLQQVLEASQTVGRKPVRIALLALTRVFHQDWDEANPDEAEYYRRITIMASNLMGVYDDQASEDRWIEAEEGPGTLQQYENIQEDRLRYVVGRMASFFQEHGKSVPQEIEDYLAS